MKVLHLIGSLDPGGAETLLLDIASRERTAGHDHSIAHLGNNWVRSEARRRGVPERLLPATALYRSNITLFLWSAILARVIRSVEPDVIHAHLFGMTVCGGLAGRLARIPCVATVHDRYYLEEKRKRGWLMGWAGPRDGLVAVSDAVARTIRDTTGNSARVITNGVDTERFRPDPQARREVREANGAGDDPVIITVGRLEPVKCQEAIIEAAGRLNRNGAAIRVWIIGEGSRRGALGALIDRLGMRERVRLLGQREDVHRYLAAADLFVLSSESEGMPVALLEAMAAGLPSVARSVGGIPEVLIDGETGLLYDRADGIQLAETIHRALDPERRRPLGEAARARACAEYSIDRMVREYRSLYEQSIKGHDGRIDNESR